MNQDDIPGTGRAVQCAMAQLTEAGKVDGPVLIAASDMPLLDSETLHRLVEFHTASGNGATVLTTILDDPTGYGRSACPGPPPAAPPALAKATCCASSSRKTPTAANSPCRK